MSRSQAPAWNAAQLYDLFILGLSWTCNENNTKTITRSGLGIFYALYHAGVVGDTQRERTVTNIELVNYFEYLADIDFDGMPATLEQICDVLSVSQQHIVVFVPPRQLLNRAKFFGPRGYSLGIAPAGRTYAESIEPTYAEIITPVKLSEGWQKYTNWVRAMHGRNRDMT